MRTYKLVAAINFTDVHTDEKYKAGQELNVSEERALELFSSPNHLVKYVSHEDDDDTDIASIISEKDALKTENDTLKKDLENLTEEYDKLKLQLENNKDDTSGKTEDTSKKNK